jgi:1,4-dihydroxy-6-naphthoate synthase
MASTTNLTLAFSPCPNDCFMFDALVNKRIPNASILQYSLSDIQDLNEAVISGKGPDVSKVSFAALPHILSDYQLLDVGAAMGYGNGPLLISASANFPMEGINANTPIAIPGMNTTANALLRHALGNELTVVPMLFSEIEDKVARKEFPLGLIIHENRFTYARKGLFLCLDLGAHWEKTTGLPVPLGAIVIKRSLPDAVKISFCQLLRKSIQYAFDFPETSNQFVAQHAQEMDAEVCKQHIALYVNSFSLSMGEKGMEAARVLLKLLGYDADFEKDCVFV